MFGQLHVDPDHLAVVAQQVPRSANFGVRRSRTGGEGFDAALGTDREGRRINGNEVLFVKRLVGAGVAGRWLPDAKAHRWIPPERATLGHVVRHFLAEGRAQTTLRACDAAAVAPAVVLGESPGAVALRLQYAVGRLALGQPALFGHLRRAHLASAAGRPSGAMDFVVGHPRSGTNLITRVLNASGTEVAAHEHIADRTLLGTLVEAATDHYEGRLPAEDVKALIRGARLDPGVRIDSSWKSVWILPPLMDLYPDARFLHITRDPRENVIACHNLDYYGEVGWRPEFDAYPMSRWLRAMPKVRRPGWDQLSAFEKNCEFWVETHRLILDTLASCPESVPPAPPGGPPRRRGHDGRLPLLRPAHAVAGGARPRPRNPDQRQVPRQAPRRAAEARHPPPLRGVPGQIRRTLHRICGPMAERLGYRLDG